MFIASNEDESKRLVSQICEHFGWDISDLGRIESSRYLEPMCLVTTPLSYSRNESAELKVLSAE